MANQIAPALRGLSETLYRGFADIGESKRKASELGLLEAKTRYDIEQGIPARKLAELRLGQAQRQEEELTTPFKVPEYLQNFGMNTGQKIWASKMVPKIGSIFGAEYNPGSGTFVKKDGTEVTNEDFKRNYQAIQGMIATNTDGTKMLQDEIAAGNQEAYAVLQEAQKNPLSYLNYQLNNKLAALHYAEGLNIPPEALTQMIKGVEYTRNQIAKQTLSEKEEKQLEKLDLELAEMKKPEDVKEVPGYGLLKFKGGVPVKQIAKPTKEEKPKLDKIEKPDKEGNVYTIDREYRDGTWVVIGKTIKKSNMDLPKANALIVKLNKDKINILDEKRPQIFVNMIENLNLATPVSEKGDLEEMKKAAIAEIDMQIAAIEGWRQKAGFVKETAAPKEVMKPGESWKDYVD